jgi:hypothetical protein
MTWKMADWSLALPLDWMNEHIVLMGSKRTTMLQRGTSMPSSKTSVENTKLVNPALNLLHKQNSLTRRNSQANLEPVNALFHLVVVHGVLPVAVTLRSTSTQSKIWFQRFHRLVEFHGDLKNL